VDAVRPAAEVVARIGREYEVARARLGLSAAAAAE